jgi:hypothetical protein
VNELARLLAPDAASDRAVRYATGTVTAWSAGVSNTVSVAGGVAGPTLDDVPYLSNVGAISVGDNVAMLVYQGQYLILGKITAL